MMIRIKRFLASDAGAITVDWVVLTSFLVTLGASVLYFVGGSANTKASEIGDHLSAMEAPSVTFN